MLNLGLRVQRPPHSFSSFNRYKSDITEVTRSFTDGKISYAGKSFAQLTRGYVVFTMCRFKFLVQNSDKILNQATRVFGSRVVNSLLRASFFGHFIGGEDEQSIRPVVSFLKQNGIGGILDYAAEADISKAPVPETTKAGVVQCRVYDYTGELQCDANVNIFKSCILAVHNTTPEGFAAIKITALGPPQILENLSAALVETQNLFAKFDINGDGMICIDEFRKVCQELDIFHDTPDEIDRIHALFDSMKTGYIDYIEWMKSIHLETLWGLLDRNEGLRKYRLNEEEKKLMDSMVNRLKILADYAAGLKVRLMVDAEQTYFQPAIDHLVLDLQRKYNTAYPCIFNTYQAYLKNSLTRVQNDIIRAQREGYYFAAKIVRGAYLVLERKRAEEKGYEDPIWPTLEDTHNNYHQVLDLVFQNMHTGANILVATHNQGSIEYTLQKMEKLNLSKENIYFGQLLGMADNLTFNLGRNGYKAYKYVPYGPINEVVPYLIRRVQENSNILSMAQVERNMLTKEIFRRLFSGEFFKRPSHTFLTVNSPKNNQ